MSYSKEVEKPLLTLHKRQCRDFNRLLGTRAPITVECKISRYTIKNKTLLEEVSRIRHTQAKPIMQGKDTQAQKEDQEAIMAGEPSSRLFASSQSCGAFFADLGHRSCHPLLYQVN